MPGRHPVALAQQDGWCRAPPMLVTATEASHLHPPALVHGSCVALHRRRPAGLTRSWPFSCRAKPAGHSRNHAGVRRVVAARSSSGMPFANWATPSAAGPPPVSYRRRAVDYGLPRPCPTRRYERAEGAAGEEGPQDGSSVR